MMMDEFWTDSETARRRDARDYFRRLPDPGSATAPTPPAEIWRDLDGAPVAAGRSPSARSLLGGRVSMIVEAASHDPKLGRDLLTWRAATAPVDPLEERTCRLGWLAGAAAHVVEAGARAARERGSFSSSLMGCREVQESLAGLVSGGGLVRFATCRLCRLLERGERDRAGRESARLEAMALAFAADVRTVALSLLGERWVEANLPADGPPLGEERTP